MQKSVEAVVVNLAVLRKFRVRKRAVVVAEGDNRSVQGLAGVRLRTEAETGNDDTIDTTRSRDDVGATPPCGAVLP